MKTDIKTLNLRIDGGIEVEEGLVRPGPEIFT